MSNKIKKPNKKLLVSIICFLGITLLMFVSYNIFKTLNNQLMNEIGFFTMEELVLLPNSEHAHKFEKTMLYYNLGIASKYIGCCTLVVTTILSCFTVYKHFKTN